MLRFAALIAVALLLAPSLAAAQGTAPVGTVSDDETTVSRAYDGDPATGSIIGIFAIGSVADTESQAIGEMATIPPIVASSLGSAVEESGVTVGEPETLAIAPIGDQSTGLRVPYTMFGASLQGEIILIGVRQSTWVQVLIGMGVGEAGVQAQLEELARQLLPRWPSADPVSVRPDGLRMGGIWNMAPLPEDLPAGFTVDPAVEDGPAAGTVSPVPGASGTTPAAPGATPSPSLDLPLLPTPTPPAGETPAPVLPTPAPPVAPIETPAPPVEATETPAPADVATPAPNPRVALPFDVTVEIFLPLDMATVNEDGSCSGTGLLDGLTAEADITIQGASGAGETSASAPVSGPGQVALDRETGEEICYFRATVTEVPPRARYSLLAGETVLGQYTYDELTDTGSVLVIVDGEE